MISCVSCVSSVSCVSCVSCVCVCVCGGVVLCCVVLCDYPIVIMSDIIKIKQVQFYSVANVHMFMGLIIININHNTFCNNAASQNCSKGFVVTTTMMCCREEY